MRLCRCYVTCTRKSDQPARVYRYSATRHGPSYGCEALFPPKRTPGGGTPGHAGRSASAATFRLGGGCGTPSSATAPPPGVETLSVGKRRTLFVYRYRSAKKLRRAVASSRQCAAPRRPSAVDSGRGQHGRPSPVSRSARGRRRWWW